MTGNLWMRGLNMTCTRPLIFSFSMPACSSIAFKHVTILTVHTHNSPKVMMPNFTRHIHSSIPACRHALIMTKAVVDLSSYSNVYTCKNSPTKANHGMQPGICLKTLIHINRGSKTLRAVLMLMLITLMDATNMTEHMTRLWRTYCEHDSIGYNFGNQVRHKRHLLGHGLDVQLYILQIN